MRSTTDSPGVVNPSTPGETSTDSGIPVPATLSAKDLEPGLDERLGDPGSPPYTRGPYATMYRERLWTMRQYAGYGSAEDTNRRYRFLLGQGQTALSVAFDLPTQLGYDSSDPIARPEVGRVGVAIDTAEDMMDLFEGLSLDRLSVNFTINATAPIILAMYLVTAEQQGVDPKALAGTLQNDILKEFLARKAFIYPPDPSMRLACDVVEFSSRVLPRFNPISVTGYHAREAGSTAIQELAFTMASAVSYCEELTNRGLEFDSFAPRLSFHFATTMDLFEEVAKLRAARRMWYRIATDRFGAQDPRSGRLRFFSGNSGTTLTAQQPLNNIVRSTIQCLGAVLGGAQSIHVMGYDEAYEIPTEEAVTLSLRTQQIIAYESGVARTIDPLGGSFYVEWLTDQLERRAGDVFEAILEGGGMVLALASGIPQRQVAETAYQQELEISSGRRLRVGVNVFQDDTSDEGGAFRLFEFDEAIVDRQVQRTVQRLRHRDTRAHARAMRELESDTRRGRNVMPSLINAARACATVGEMSDVFRQLFGEFREPHPW